MGRLANLLHVSSAPLDRVASASLATGSDLESRFDSRQGQGFPSSPQGSDQVGFNPRTVGEVSANFCGCSLVSVTDPYGRILGYLD
jgi:hypothetical protein